MASPASPLFRLQDVTRGKNACDIYIGRLWRGVFRVRVVVRKGSCSMLEICQPTFLTPVYWHAAFRYPTRHDVLHKPRKKKGGHKTPEGAQSIRPAFPRCSHKTHPTSLLVNAHRVQKKGDTPSTLRKNDAALVIQRIRAPTQGKVMGGVQIRLRFCLRVAPVDD